MNELDLHLRVLGVIQQHDLKDPITIPQLTEMFGLPPDHRRTKSIIKKLVDNGHKIGSSKVEPMGLFLARNPEEMFETAERLRQEARKIFAKANKLMDFGSHEPTVWEQPTQEAA